MCYKNCKLQTVQFQWYYLGVDSLISEAGVWLLLQTVESSFLIMTVCESTEL